MLDFSQLKRTAAISFLLVLLFNLYGYRWVMATLEKQSAAAMDQLADKKGYNTDELISIKTTLNLPYYTSTSTYERAYGSVDVNGITYQYVMRRVYQDTLELLCLPNGAVKKIKEAKNSIAAQSADASSGAPHKAIAKVMLPDLFHATASDHMIPVASAVSTYNPVGDVLISSAELSQPERPPCPLQCT